jgi:hypothetical protein
VLRQSPLPRQARDQRDQRAAATSVPASATRPIQPGSMNLIPHAATRDRGEAAGQQRGAGVGRAERDRDGIAVDRGVMIRQRRPVGHAQRQLKVAR